MKQVENDSPSRRSPRIAAKQFRRHSLALHPTRSCLRKNDDTTTNFDLLQEDNTNLLGITCDNTATFTFRNFDDTGTLDENGRRRKSAGRRVSFAATAHVRLFDKDEVADEAPAKSNNQNFQNEKPATELILSLPSTPSPNNSLMSNNDSPKCADEQVKSSIPDSQNVQNEKPATELMSSPPGTPSPNEGLISNNDPLKCADEQDMSTVEDMSLDELDMSLVDVTSKEQGNCLLDFPTPMLLEANEAHVEHATDVLTDMGKDMLIDQDQTRNLPATEIFDMSIVRSENDHYSPIRVSSEEKNVTGKQFLEFTDMSLVEATQMTLEEDVEMSIDEEDTCMSLNQRFMNEAIDEQNAQIQIFENELENLKNDLLHLQNHCTKLKNEKLELIHGIEEAKRLIQDNKCFTENDLKRYQEQYENLRATYKWQPQKLSGDLIHMIYDNSLQIRIDLKAICNQNKGDAFNIVDLNLTSNDDMEKEDKQYYELMLCSLRENENIVQIPMHIGKIPKIFKYVTAYWQKVKQFHEEICVVRFKFPIETIAEEDDGRTVRICIRVLFFNSEVRSKFFVNFLLRPENIMSYPNLEKNIEWQVNKSYGNINEGAISDAIKTHLLRGEIGCIKAACVEINKKGFFY